MKLKTAAIILLLGAASTWAPAADLAIAAKLVKIIASSAGGKVSCRDAAMKAALEGAGVTVDNDAKIAWATNPVEIKMLRSQNRLVITGNKAFLGSGAGIAITEEGGKPKIYLNQANITPSGVTLSDAIYKVGSK